MIRPFSLVVALIAAAPAFAGQDAVLKAQFQARYDAFVKAYQNKDLKTIDKMLAKDFTGGSTSREQTKQQTLDDLKYLKTPFTTKWRKVMTVIPNGGRASVMEESLTTGSLPDPKTKKIHQFEIQVRSLDTWEKNGSVWRILHLRPIKTKTLMDGHPFKGDRNH